MRKLIIVTALSAGITVALSFFYQGGKIRTAKTFAELAEQNKLADTTLRAIDKQFSTGSNIQDLVKLFQDLDAQEKPCNKLFFQISKEKLTSKTTSQRCFSKKISWGPCADSDHWAIVVAVDDSKVIELKTSVIRHDGGSCT